MSDRSEGVWRGVQLTRTVPLQYEGMICHTFRLMQPVKLVLMGVAQFD